MAQTPVARRFPHVPVITLDRIKREPRTAFSIEKLPGWVQSITLITTDPNASGPDDPKTTPDEALIIVGHTHRRRVTVNLVALAVLAEMTRYGGINVHTNSNGKGGVYARMSFPNVRGKNIDVRRILYDAPAGERTRAIWRPHDYNPENTGTEPDGHAHREAREKALTHVAAAARDEAPDPDAYLRNLHALFAELDRIRDGGP